MFGSIVKSKSKWKLTKNNVFVYIVKKNKNKEEWWPRLFADKVNNKLISTDWKLWIGQDDSEH